MSLNPRILQQFVITSPLQRTPLHGIGRSVAYPIVPYVWFGDAVSISEIGSFRIRSHVCYRDLSDNQVGGRLPEEFGELIHLSCLYVDTRRRLLAAF